MNVLKMFLVSASVVASSLYADLRTQLPLLGHGYDDESDQVLSQVMTSHVSAGHRGLKSSKVRREDGKTAQTPVHGPD